MSRTDKSAAERRGFLRTLGLGGVAAAAAVGVAEAAEPAGYQRADSVPSGLARKENEAERVKARYQANAADVQAFYRTNRYGD
ncbi:twin-arginine translocation signal domain-containing protein [Roseomonas sp. HJA6]|uniref:Twin-arginine translocation signal domain-containing protein n=1 Tax=Roseomonas alba TaxID=2846776 RepID=A0ABS7AEV1_9PROT|nr:twin-arginine translocation signal domain-containing protein [Neoroseomonas alba]MBW6400837.1 twin-arginine translocation signal domain-containing protein [Neoroseomonas alba]